MISHCDEDTNFYDEKIPKMDFNHTCQQQSLKEFLKQCKYIKKKVIRHVTNGLESSPDGFDDSDEEQIKAMRLIFFREAMLKISFLRE